jgi:hypothetical protein
MSTPVPSTNLWIWPHVGATPISQGLDSEMFDRTDYPYTETFVREAIQNTLDARLDHSKPAIINFRFHEDRLGPRHALLTNVMAFRSKAGLDVPDEWKAGTIRWLVVEDFNTKGLSGALDSRTSDFWNYWLNFGVSNKDGSGRGGRGIGRVTFLISSRLQSVIGYTRRSADKSEAICGMTVLRAREDGKKFLSTHAYLAHAERDAIYDLHEEPQFRKALCDAFGFTGYSGKHTSGLALAIPYPHQELEPEGILAAAIENFAPAIMSGALVLGVNGRVLDPGSIGEIAAELSARFNDSAVREDVGRYLRMIRSGLEADSFRSIHLPNAQKGDLEALRQSKDCKAIQKKLESDDDVVLELTFPLERKGKDETVTLTAVLARTPQGMKPMDRLFREGMSLPDVRARNPGDTDLIVLVEDERLATYLNFCEGKAHLDLLESKDIRQKLKDNGFGEPPKVMRARRLLKNIPADLRQLFTPDMAEPDASVFDTFFSKPSDLPGKRQKPVVNPAPPEPPPPPKPRIFKIETLEDGLRISANPENTDWPVNLTLTIAYADGSRNPSWSPYDFGLADMPKTVLGCEYDIEKNRLRARNCTAGCLIEIRGFDSNRELDASIRPWKDATEN